MGLNRSVIQSFSPLTLSTGGDGTHAVVAESGIGIGLFSGSSAFANGRDATGRAATGAESTITATQRTIRGDNPGGYGAAATDGAAIFAMGGPSST